MASAVPRRSTMAATPAHADGHIGEAPPPRPSERVATRSRPRSTPARARNPSRMRRAERSASTGSSAAWPSAHVGEVDARVGADEAVGRLA